jgi:hypothetical protein
MKPTPDFINGIKYAIEICNDLRLTYDDVLDEQSDDDRNDVTCIMSGINEIKSMLERRVMLFKAQE